MAAKDYMHISINIEQDNESRRATSRVEIIIDPAATRGEHHESHRITVRSEVALCEIKSMLFEAMMKLVDKELPTRPRVMYDEPCAAPERPAQDCFVAGAAPK